MTAAALVALLAVTAQAQPPAPGEPAGAALGLPALPAEVSYVRDLRPTTLGAGDTLVIECPGVIPGEPAEVRLEGRRAGGAGGLRFEGTGRALRGDRVLLPIEARARPVRLEQVAVEVQQGIRFWRLPPGQQTALEITPPSLERAARAAAAATTGALAARGVTLPAPLAPLLPYLVVAALALVIHLLVAPLTGLVIVWERKIWGRMQSRIGPNRVGPGGWLQWLADGLKLILKEDVVPTDADAPLFRFAPYLMWMAVFATFVVLPLTATAVVADLNVGLLFLVSVTSLTVIAVLLGGWTSNSKWSLIGGMRSAAQIVSYELPGAMALVVVALMAGTLSPQEIVRAQGGLPHQWFVFANPFAFAAFFIYFIAGLAEGNRTPFDLPEAESELVAGFTTEYSGFRYSVFGLAEWTNLYVLGAIVSLAFLGGWNVPFVPAAVVAASPGLQLVGAAAMVAKIVALVFIVIWIRATLPRFRLDQLMALCWKYLVPLSFACFMGTAAFMWAARALPALDPIARWSTFLVGGVAVALLFIGRVVASYRGSRLYDVGAR
jgi:NADH:ubiquinone oxidoreductase subunit H